MEFSTVVLFLVVALGVGAFVYIRTRPKMSLQEAYRRRAKDAFGNGGHKRDVDCTICLDGWRLQPGFKCRVCGVKG